MVTCTKLHTLTEIQLILVCSDVVLILEKCARTPFGNLSFIYLFVHLFLDIHC